MSDEGDSAYLMGYQAAYRWSDQGCPGERPPNPFDPGTSDHDDWDKAFHEGMDDWHYSQ